MIEKERKEYQLYIFDLDGTLYYQNKLRIHIFLMLLQYYIRRPFFVRDLVILIEYRKIREKWKVCEKNEGIDIKKLQLKMVADKMKLPISRVENVVTMWIMDKPLQILKKYRDESICKWMEALKEQGKTIVVYSDYPTEEKLEIMEIKVDKSYSSEDGAINEMKPSPKGIEVILQEQKGSKVSTVMIGDRFEKDGQAAEAAGIDYIILGASKWRRKQQLKFV